MRSIERHLVSWVLGAMGLGALLFALAAYLVILEGLSEAFDENLKQVALALVDHVPADSTLPHPPAASAAEAARVASDEIIVLRWTSDGQRVYASKPRVRLPFVARTGLSRQHDGAVAWDVYTVIHAGGAVQVAQQVVAQQFEAAESAATLFLPLLALLGALLVLLVVSLRRGLRPLDAAAADVAARSAASLEAIDDSSAPRELRPLVRALNDLMGRLSTAFSAQRHFVADAAHELRTPVTALRLQLDLLERATDEAARHAAIAELRAGVDRSQRLTEQLLQLSRAEPGSQPAAHASVALGKLAREAVGRFCVKADHRRIDLGADAPDALPVQGDQDQLEILLNNLVENALRYTPAGGVVDVVAASVDGRPTLSVLDTGPGITAQDRSRVFDRFHRTDNRPAATDETGSGLGLAIVKAIADAHGADVSLHDRPGGTGLAVRVSFPASATPQRAA